MTIRIPAIPIRTILRIAVTLVIAAIAIGIGITLWHHYMDAPWTRDGRVVADVTVIAPDVSGLITNVAVHDNEQVHQGDLLFAIDPSRYRDAVTQARAALTIAKANAAMAHRKLVRREHLSGAVISRENLQTMRTQARAARAKLAQEHASLALAQLNLKRSVVRAPSDGHITHLNVFTGDYAAAGKPMLSLVSDAFYVEGYFEETKLDGIHVGDPVSIHLLRDGPTLHGHVESIASGIANLDERSGKNLLAQVKPTFSWVRLAQRVPVRIALDSVPKDVKLASGMTCTVVVHRRRKHRSRNAYAQAGAKR
jgi:RND family efflux transporter MFP subunit